MNRFLVRLICRARPVELASILKTVFRVGHEETTVGGFRLWLDHASYLGQCLLTTGAYEPAMTAAISELLGAGDDFIDLGANEGWFSLIAATKVGDRGRVLAIEPQERVWPVLLRNFALNQFGQCQIAPFAVGENEGRARIVLTPSRNTGSSSMVSNIRATMWGRQWALVRTLDHVLDLYAFRRVKLMKVDIEGFELFALRSAARSLAAKRVLNILVEFHPAHLAMLGHDPAELYALMDSHGYKHHTLHGLELFTCE